MSYNSFSYGLKLTFALSPFVIATTLVLVSTIYHVHISTGIIFIMTLLGLYFSKNELYLLHAQIKAIQANTSSAMGKNSVSHDYMAFFDAIYQNEQKISSYAEYMECAEKLYPAPSPFVGKKIKVYYADGSLYKQSKNTKSSKKLENHSIENKFSEWKNKHKLIGVDGTVPKSFPKQA